jgi:hypothetical protein
MNNSAKKSVLSECLEKGSIVDKTDTDDKNIALSFFLFSALGSKDPDDKAQMRIAYEYVDNGQVKYAYTPSLIASLNSTK